MGLYINTNAAALNTQRHLLHSTTNLQRSFQRLSSGLRVNSARDDAAGLAISERFTSQVRGLSQAARNANDGISIAQVAEGALEETTSVLQRMRELAVQAANDINTDADRRALQEEVAQLIDELQRIGDTTTFNQQKVLDGTFLARHLHVGMNARETLAVSVRDSRADALGRYAVLTGAAVSNQGLGNDELLINGVTIRATSASDDAVSTSLNLASAIAKAAAINDSTPFHKVTAQANRTVRAGVADIGGGTLDGTDHVVINGRVITGLVVTPNDADDALVGQINAELAASGVVATLDRHGRVELRAEDGRNIEVVVNGNGGAITGLGAAGVTRAALTLHSEDQYQVAAAVGGAGAHIGFSDAALVGVGTVQSIHTVDISTRDGANLALEQIDRAIGQVARTRSELGAVQNRLESTISNLTAVAENAASARSRILDADFAVETAALTRFQILQQAATNILAQANQQPGNVLSLLG